MDMNLYRPQPNFLTSVDPGSRVKHKDECGEGKRGAGGYKDYTGTNNPFTMVCMSGF